jgi:hypothetical protein
MSLCFCITSHAENLQMPAPDFANYPNSAFTLPQHHAAVEIASFYTFYNNKNLRLPSEHNIGYLMRYGLTNAIELRLQSDGFSLNDNHKEQLGLSPQIFDIKWHVIDAPINSFLPAMAIEGLVQTEWASPAFKDGIHSALSLNFDQNLPYHICIEYNIGFIAQRIDSQRSLYQLALSWAVQRAIINDVEVFIHGYTNTAAGDTVSVIGGGVQWTLLPGVVLFANANQGLNKYAPEFVSLFGFSVAF